MEINVYFYILFGSLNKSQSSQVCEPHSHRIYTRMTRSQPSLRLKQISRIISRQRDDDTVITSTFLSITLILLIIFLTGLSMLTAGLVIFDSCHQSWLPTWLLVCIMINKRSKLQNITKKMFALMFKDAVWANTFLAYYMYACVVHMYIYCCIYVGFSFYCSLLDRGLESSSGLYCCILQWQWQPRAGSCWKGLFRY